MLNIDVFIQKKQEEDKERLVFEDELNGYRIDMAQKLSENGISEMTFVSIPVVAVGKVVVKVTDKFKQCNGMYSKSDCEKIILVTAGVDGQIKLSHRAEFSILKYLLSESESDNK